MTALVIPGINDHELPDLLSAAAASGASFAAYVPGVLILWQRSMKRS